MRAADAVPAGAPWTSITLAAGHLDLPAAFDPALHLPCGCAAGRTARVPVRRPARCSLGGRGQAAEIDLTAPGLPPEGFDLSGIPTSGTLVRAASHPRGGRRLRCRRGASAPCAGRHSQPRPARPICLIAHSTAGLVGRALAAEEGVTPPRDRRYPARGGRARCARPGRSRGGAARPCSPFATCSATRTAPLGAPLHALEVAADGWLPAPDARRPTRARGRAPTSRRPRSPRSTPRSPPPERWSARPTPPRSADFLRAVLDAAASRLGGFDPDARASLGPRPGTASGPGSRPSCGWTSAPAAACGRAATLVRDRRLARGRRGPGAGAARALGPARARRRPRPARSPDPGGVARGVGIRSSRPGGGRSTAIPLRPRRGCCSARSRGGSAHCPRRAGSRPSATCWSRSAWSSWPPTAPRPLVPGRARALHARPGGRPAPARWPATPRLLYRRPRAPARGPRARPTATRSSSRSPPASASPSPRRPAPHATPPGGRPARSPRRRPSRATGALHGAAAASPLAAALDTDRPEPWTLTLDEPRAAPRPGRFRHPAPKRAGAARGAPAHRARVDALAGARAPSRCSTPWRSAAHRSPTPPPCSRTPAAGSRAPTWPGTPAALLRLFDARARPGGAALAPAGPLPLRHGAYGPPPPPTGTTRSSPSTGPRPPAGANVELDGELALRIVPGPARQPPPRRHRAARRPRRDRLARARRSPSTGAGRVPGCEPAWRRAGPEAVIPLVPSAGGLGAFAGLDPGGRPRGGPPARPRRRWRAVPTPRRARRRERRRRARAARGWAV